MKSSELIINLIEKYPELYQKSYTSSKVKNIKGTTLEEFKKHILSIHETANIKKIVYKRYDGGVSDTFPTILYDEYKICLCGKSVATSIGSDTIFKEGMVCYFYASKLSYDISLINTYDELLFTINTILSDINLNSIEGLSKNDISYIIGTLEQYITLNESDLKIRIKNIFNALSIGNYLRNTIYKKDGWIINKNDLFNNIKRTGGKLTGLKPDKWNPMDIMLYRPNTETSIQYKLLNNSINNINTLYVCDILKPSLNEDILGISLKEENAQFGKGKGYLNVLKNKFDLNEYNLSSKELDNIKINYKDEIIKYRNYIIENCKNTLFDYKQEGENHNDTSLYGIDKCKALHLIKYIIDAQLKSDEVEIINLLKFALSIGQNPIFYKFVGNEQGLIDNVKIQKFNNTTNIKLLNKINIIDSINKNKGIKLEFNIEKDEKEMFVRILVRNNGSDATNAAIEVQTLK